VHGKETPERWQCGHGIGLAKNDLVSVKEVSPKVKPPILAKHGPTVLVVFPHLSILLVELLTTES
jgi:hypothetical protein